MTESIVDIFCWVGSFLICYLFWFSLNELEVFVILDQLVMMVGSATPYRKHLAISSA